MGRALHDFLRKQLSSHSLDYVVPYFSKNENVPKHVIERTIKTFKEFYSISKDWGAHSLRHSFAYNFLRKGGDIKELQRMLGHNNVYDTKRLYGEAAEEKVQQDATSPY